MNPDAQAPSHTTRANGAGKREERDERDEKRAAADRGKHEQTDTWQVATDETAPPWP